MSATDEFYVGYLPAGVKQKLVLRFLVPAIAFALLAVASLLAMGTPPAGTGLWFTLYTNEYEGTFFASPYAHILADDGSAMIVVDAGKGGIRDGIGELDGDRVRAEGFPISRDGMTILELLPGVDGLAGIEGVTTRPAVPDIGLSVELIGEVLDLKCFLGAMKPGSGVTHRGCAVLCVRGGIPPAVQGEDGVVRLLVNEDFGAMNDGVLEYVGVEATITGDEVEFGGIRYLRVRSISRVEH